MAKLFGKDVFNSNFKNEAQQELKDAVTAYNSSTKTLNDNLEDLQLHREQLSQSLRKTEFLIDSLKNTPADFNDKVSKLKINLNNYDKLLKAAEIKSAKIINGAGTQAATGVAAGTAVGMLGGPALTALAMSVGTASTGASIVGLSGAAATNAALAWLGGGAIAAGGAGIAGGEAVLAAFGPIGWTIGGLTAATALVKLNGKNKQAASEMLENAGKVDAGTKANVALAKEVKEHALSIQNSHEDLEKRLFLAEQTWPEDFLVFNGSQVEEAGILVNNTLSAEKLLNQNLGDN